MMDTANSALSRGLVTVTKSRRRPSSRYSSGPVVVVKDIEKTSYS